MDAFSSFILLYVASVWCFQIQARYNFEVQCEQILIRLQYYALPACADFVLLFPNFFTFTLQKTSHIAKKTHSFLHSFGMIGYF